MNAASHSRNPEIITTLLKAGADAKARDRFGTTALGYAQSNAKLKDTDADRQLQAASQ
jgi:ankyrin repeat protein